MCVLLVRSKIWERLRWVCVQSLKTKRKLRIFFSEIPSRKIVNVNDDGLHCFAVFYRNHWVGDAVERFAHQQKKNSEERKKLHFLWKFFIGKDITTSSEVHFLSHRKKTHRDEEQSVGKAKISLKGSEERTYASHWCN